MSNSNEKMKVTLTLNGKQAEVEFTKEQLVALGLVEEKEKTGYERVKRNDLYYIAQIDGGATMIRDTNHSVDECWYTNAAYYSNQTVAENNARADTLMRQLRRFAAENGGIPSAEDWIRKHDGCNPSHAKYVVEYDHINKKFEVSSWVFMQKPGVVYFKSKEACEKAIEEFKDELIWYFTEYQAMLY